MAKNIWLISDTHFGHANIIKYCKRPFDNVEQMNEALIENWNSTIKPQDKVYHLGDVYSHNGFQDINDKFSFNQIDYLLGSLNGHKRLLLGNHDSGKDPVLLKNFEQIELWRMFPEMGLLLTHIPVHESALGIILRPKEFYSDVDFEEVEGLRQLWNVHGHIHQNPSPNDRYINVSVEWTDYKPIHIEELRKK